MTLAAACANCGVALVGAFCHACGQSAQPPVTTVRAFLRELADDFSRLDSRAVRSFRLLLLRPGLLTREYLRGRRVRYTRPLQLYLVAAAALFLVNAYRPFIAYDATTQRITSSLGGAAAMFDVDDATLAARAPGVPVELVGERFESAATGYLPTFLIGSVLLFALFLRLAYRRVERRYLAHAIFALHWTAFYMLLMIATRLLPHWSAQPLSVLGVVYLTLALRTVYARPWPATLLRALVLYVAYQLLLMLWMLSALSLAFALL